MKLTTLSVALAATFVFAQSAQAREHHRHHSSHREARSHSFSHRSFARRFASRTSYGYWPWTECGSPAGNANDYCQEERAYNGSTSSRYAAAEYYGGRRASRHRARGYVDAWQPAQTFSQQSPSGGRGQRPAAWCGWEMRQLVSADPGPSFNLARAWTRWGHAGPAGIGAVVVWPHHVGKIVGREGGMWVIESGNDGHRVRTRPRSIAGVIAIRWG